MSQTTKQILADIKVIREHLQNNTEDIITDADWLAVEKFAESILALENAIEENNDT